MGGDSNIELIKDGKRLDGRGFDDFRKPLTLEVGVLQEADGSAYIEWGMNKILVGVFGPKEAIPKHLADPDKATIRCIYTMSTFASLEEHGRMGPNRRANEIGKVVREALENVVMVEKFPSTIIDVYMMVLQAEGGTRVASLTGAAAALINAGIPMREPIAGVAVGKAGGHVLLDIGKEEHLADPDKATIRCIYTMSTFASLEEHGRMGPNRRANEIGKVVREALENVVMVEKFPSTIIDVYMMVLQAEGGTRVASLTGAAAALINAGIPMREPIAGVAVGKAGGHVLLDIGKEEDNYGQADVPMAFTPSGDIVLLQMDGMMTREEIAKALDMAQEGSKKLFDLQRKAFEKEYAEPLGKKLSLKEEESKVDIHKL